MICPYNPPDRPVSLIVDRKHLILHLKQRGVSVTIRSPACKKGDFLIANVETPKAR